MKTVLFLICLIAISSQLIAVGGLLPGSGTTADPYLIEDRADFDFFCENDSSFSSGGTYTRLMTDLDLSDTIYTEAPFQATYSGEFEGNGHIIIGLTIDTAGQPVDGLGLFRELIGYSGGYPDISNLGLEGVNITTAHDSTSIGCFTGKNVGTIINCYATGTIHTGNFSSEVGGITGHNRYRVKQSYADVDITTGDDGKYIGGLIGYSSSNSSLQIRQCYSIGEITTGENCTQQAGLVYGPADKVSSCYFYQWAGVDNLIGTDLDTINIGIQSSYAGFDFVGDSNDGTNEIWEITSGHLPRLHWESGDGLPVPTYGVPSTSLAGAGTKSSPFLIQNVNDFNEFRTNSQLDLGYYKLTVDLELSANVYGAALVDRQFGGDFDGNGHLLSGINIQLPSNDTDNVGLFSISLGRISKLGLTDFSLTTEGNQSNIGALCGQFGGLIEECFVSANITTGPQSTSIGGICGQILHGSILNSYASGSVSGAENVGGLAGLSSNTSIYDSPTLSNCYSIVTIPDNSSNPDKIGPLTASQIDFKDVFFYEWIGRSNRIGVPLSASAMKAEGAYTGFDFTANTLDGSADIWAIEVNSLPKLSWQTDAASSLPVYTPPTTTLTGLGTSESPFLIQDEGDFSEFITNDALFAGTYQLTSPLDLKNTSFQAAPVQRTFSGTFDGNDQVIENLSIISNETFAENLALFIETAGTIKNLRIDDFLIGSQGFHSYSAALSSNNTGSIINCSVSGELYNSDGYIGGICGNNIGTGTISECKSNTTIHTQGSSHYIGLICGYNESGTIRDSVSTGRFDLTGSKTYYVGGIVGSNNSAGVFEGCHSIATFNANGSVENLGGLCGYNYDTKILQCSAKPNIQIAGTAKYIGGLVGRTFNQYNYKVLESQSQGSIQVGNGSSYIGGLIGYTYRTSVNDAYSLTQIESGTSSNNIGGLVGRHYNKTTRRCYAAGSIITGSGSTNVGGLTGSATGNINDSFWDTEQTGQPSSSRGTGKITLEMQSQSTFTDAGWDFGGVDDDSSKANWLMVTYPEFPWSDGDNDSISNEFELLLGTDPSDPSSKLESGIESTQTLRFSPMVDAVTYKCAWHQDLSTPVEHWHALEITPTQSGESGEFALPEINAPEFASENGNAVFFKIIASVSE